MRSSPLMKTFPWLLPPSCLALLAVIGLGLWPWPGVAANRAAEARAVPELLAAPAIVGAGESVGIGVALAIDEATKMLKIAKVFPGSSAADAGVAEGDMIREINGVQTTGLALEQCVKMIRGDAGTEVTLEVLRAEDGAAIVLKLKRRAFRLTDG